MERSVIRSCCGCRLSFGSTKSSSFEVDNDDGVVSHDKPFFEYSRLIVMIWWSGEYQNRRINKNIPIIAIPIASFPATPIHIYHPPFQISMDVEFVDFPSYECIKTGCLSCSLPAPLHWYYESKRPCGGVIVRHLTSNGA